MFMALKTAASGDWILAWTKRAAAKKRPAFLDKAWTEEETQPHHQQTEKEDVEREDRPNASAKNLLQKLNYSIDQISEEDREKKNSQRSVRTSQEREHQDKDKSGA
jgi:hypothetical protein